MDYFIIFFLFFIWISNAIFKMGLPNKFYNLVKMDFIDELTNCEFCMETHISFILALLGFCFLEPTISLKSSILYEVFGDFCFFALAPLSVAISHILKGFYR